MSERILITGGAGFIGSHLADAYLAAGYSVRVLDNLDPQVHPLGGPAGRPPDYLSRDVEFVHGDVRDPAVVRRALQGVDILSHHAARVGVGQSMYQVADYVSANTLGAATVLDVVVNDRIPLRKMLVASSMSVYGEGEYQHPNTLLPMHPNLRSEDQLRQRQWEMTAADGTVLEPVATSEDKPLRPTSVYAITKRDHEELFLSTGRAYAIPSVAFRYFNVYGTRQALSNPYTGVVAIFSNRLLTGRAPLVFEDGRQRRDFVSVNDIVAANVAATRVDTADYEVLNIGSGRGVSINEVAVTVATALGADVEPEVTARYRVGDVRHCFADIRKAERLLPWRPSGDLGSGIGPVAEWVSTQVGTEGFDDMAKELDRRGLAR